MNLNNKILIKNTDTGTGIVFKNYSNNPKISLGDMVSFNTIESIDFKLNDDVFSVVDQKHVRA